MRTRLKISKSRLVMGLMAVALGGGGAVWGQQQSINAGSVVNGSPAGQAKSAPNRVEFFVHDWTMPVPSFGAVIQSGAVGVDVVWSAGALQIYNTWETGGVNCRIAPPDSITQMYVRFQHDPVNNWDICEAWDNAGNLIYRSYPMSFTSGGTGSGTSAITVTASSTKIGWVRLLTTLVPAGSQMPIAGNVEAGRLLDWKFDGNLLDSSGNGYAGSGTGVTYSASPTAGLVPVARTLLTPYLSSYSGYNAEYTTPYWADWVSLKAGAINQLSAANSASQIAAPSMSYFWQQVAGPSTLTWSSRTAVQPLVSGAVFGQYTIRLTSSDGTNTASVDQVMGAVAHTDQGVVINAKSQADILFGPMSAYGRSPWGFTDNRALAVRTLQPPYFALNGFGPTPPTWTTPNTSGTVAFYRQSGQAGPSTTLSAGITSTATAIPVTDAAQLDLSNLPTFIIIGSGTSYETILITATTATTGPATLTAAFGGRGISGNAVFYTVLPAQAHSAGATVRQGLLSGTGTSFSADAAKPICPGGVPGPAGNVAYTVGTAAISGTVVTGGGGASWSAANGVYAGQFIRVDATHSGGTPFTWWATISSVDSTTQLTLEKSPPAGTDAGAFAYKIINNIAGGGSQFYLAPNMPQDDGRNNFFVFATLGCASDTRASLFNIYEANQFTPTQFSGQPYTTFYGQSPGTEFGPNFYGSGLALRADYYRSGSSAAKAAADQMDNYWVRHPWIRGGNFLFRVGGGYIGAITCLVLGDCSNLSWDDVRNEITTTRIQSATDCNNMDLRDRGYAAALSALGAVFDPTYSSTYATYLATAKSSYQNCTQSNTFASGYYFGPGQTFNLVNGSTAGTGTGLTTAICNATASGTAVATNGSGALTSVGGFIAGAAITLTGTIAGSTQSIRCGYRLNSATSIDLTCAWPGDTGVVDWMIEPNADMNVIAASNNDTANLAHNYACILNSPTSITLHRPWRGATGSYNAFRYNLSGLGQQPFMVGISALAADWGTNVPAQAADWGTIRANLGASYQTYGFNSQTLSQYYGRVFEFCEPKGATINLAFPWPTGGAGDNFLPSCLGGPYYSSGPDRVTIGEAISTTGPAIYAADPTPANKAFADNVYTALWGSYVQDGTLAPITPDPYALGNIPQLWNTSDAWMGAYKYPGFFFGVGQAHRWPAVRNGGIPAQSLTTYQFAFRLPSAATRIALTITRPSGETVTPATCTTSPCPFTFDSRQGTHYVRWVYQDGGGNTVGQGGPVSVY